MKQLLFLFCGATILVAFNLTDRHFISPSIINSKQMAQDTAVPVKVELEKTTCKDMQLLFIKDTAPTTEAIKDVIGKGYGELTQYITENQLKPGKFMAWYYAMQPPWPMDIAVETDGTPANLKGRIQSRIQPGGEYIIAHVWGPYDQVGVAYVQLENWLKKNNRKAKAAPFEVYINDPASVKTPMEIRTDVYQYIE
jgi:effector-binding domain-containing protein